MSATYRRPSTFGYWLAAVIGLAGLVGAVLWGIRTATTLTDSATGFPRAPIPGDTAVEVADVGSRLVYYEAPATSDVPPLDIRVIDPAGAVVAVESYGLDLRYDMAGHVGRAIATFAADTPGTYRVSVQGEPSADADFAVGPSLAQGIVPILGAIALLVVAPILSALIAIVTAIRRSRTLTAPSEDAGAPPRVPVGAVRP